MAAEEDPQLQYLLAVVTLLSGCASVLFFCSVGIDHCVGLGRPQHRVSRAAAILALSASWYCISMTLTLVNRLMMGYRAKFSWPVTLSISHMAVKGLLALGTIVAVSAVPAGLAQLSPPRRAVAVLVNLVKSQELTTYLIWAILVPLGASTAIDIVLSAVSLMYIDVSVYTVAKSTALIFTLLFSLCAGLQRPALPLLGAVAAVAAGVVMCSVRAAAVDPTGLVCVIAAAACGAMRWVLTERYFGRRGVPSNPLLLIALLSPITVATLLPALAWEAPRMAASETPPAISSSEDVGVILTMTLGGGALAFLLLLVELQLVRMTSALTLNVIGHFKDVVVIGLAIPIFHETLTPLNAAGVALTVAGTTLYSVHKARARRRAAGDGGEWGPVARLRVGPQPYTLIDASLGGRIDDDMELAVLAQAAGTSTPGRFALDFDDDDDEMHASNPAVATPEKP